MEPRRTVIEYVKLQIPQDPKTYKTDIQWSKVLECKVEPNDVFHEIGFIEEQESGMFSMKMEDELVSYQIPYLVVKRLRLENDQEYFARLKMLADGAKLRESREHDEYLRLKAKFESNDSNVDELVAIINKHSGES